MLRRTVQYGHMLRITAGSIREITPYSMCMQRKNILFVLSFAAKYLLGGKRQQDILGELISVSGFLHTLTTPHLAAINLLPVQELN